MNMIMLFFVCYIAVTLGQLLMNDSLAEELFQWANFSDNHHLIEAFYPVRIPCMSSGLSSIVVGNVFTDSKWTDFKGMPIAGDFVTNGTIYLKHAQHEDNRKMLCHLNSNTTFEHYLIVYDIPRVRLEYKLIYKTPMCLEQLIQQKATNIDLLIKHNPITLHHGLIYSVGDYSCYYPNNFDTAFATVTIYCEDRIRDFKLTCKTLDCYYSQTKDKLINASIESANRWLELESYPQNYPEILKSYIRMPEFKLESKNMEPNFVNLCPDKYFLWKDALCLPCVSGHHFNNVSFNCTKCPRNTYQPFDLMTACFPCPSNERTDSIGADDVKFCHPSESEEMQFIHENKIFIIILGLIVLVTIILLLMNMKMKRGYRVNIYNRKLEAFERLPTEEFVSMDVLRKSFVHSIPNVIELSREDFLLKAGKNRRKVKQKFDKFTFGL